MSDPNEKLTPPTRIEFDFSRKDHSKQRDAAEAEADRQLRAEPRFRELSDRIADDEDRMANNVAATGYRQVLGGLGIAGVTAVVDIAVGQAFHMQQFLQGEDVTEWSQRITHGAILGLGGIPAFIQGARGMAHLLDAEAQHIAARQRRRY